MLNDATGFEKIYIACGYTDLRLGIDGLACLIKSQFLINPFTPNTLFLFCGRKPDRIKGLIWEGDGFLLLYKRLEASKYSWPRSITEVQEMSPQQFRWLMEGLTINPTKTVKKVYPKTPN